MAITRNQVKEWLQDEVTRAFYLGLQQLVHDAAEELMNGSTIGENTGEQTARLVGFIQGLKAARNVDLDEIIIEEEEDATSDR